MHAQLLAGLVLVGSLAYGAAIASEPGAASEATDKVDPSEVVITVNDFCPDSRGHGACTTTVSREQFDQLAEALQPGMSPPLRLRVATAYARMLKMAAAAKQRGLDRTPAFDLELRYARMQLLSQDLSRTLKENSERVSDIDIEDYYTKHSSVYEEATLARIFVPRAKRGVATPTQSTAATHPADESAMTRLAADLRARAVNGEDPDKLQADADAAAGMTGGGAKTLEHVRASTLPPSHDMVMAMKPGEVSEVLSDPGGAHFIYKMLGKRTLTLADVQAEIRDDIAGRRYRDLMSSFEGGVVLNEAYFAAPTSPPVHRGRRAASAPEPPSN